MWWQTAPAGSLAHLFVLVSYACRWTMRCKTLMPAPLCSKWKAELKWSRTWYVRQSALGARPAMCVCCNTSSHVCLSITGVP